MRELILHPMCAAGPVTKISAMVEPTREGCRATFRLEGDLDQLRIAPEEVAERTDKLWETTCFEIFWQTEGCASYTELNLAPSSRWACYEFDDYRLNGRDAPAEVQISCCVADCTLELVADCRVDLVLPAAVALNAVVDDIDGNIQYWALAFAEGKPDFHTQTCRQWKLAGRL